MTKFHLIISNLFLSIAMSGCISTNSSQATPDVVQNLDENLPQITGLRTISSNDEVGLEWDSYAQNPDVSGFAIYRIENSGAQTLIATTSKYATHFVDSSLSPAQTYRYMVKALSNSGVSQNGTIATATTAKPISSVSFAKAIGLYGATKLIWRPHADVRVKGYIIEKSEIGRDSWSTLAKLNGRLNAEYIDIGGGNYEYRISVKTINGEISAPSNPISVE